jgi:Domain of unknown function (DUF4129)
VIRRARPQPRPNWGTISRATRVARRPPETRGQQGCPCHTSLSSTPAGRGTPPSGLIAAVLAAWLLCGLAVAQPYPSAAPLAPVPGQLGPAAAGVPPRQALDARLHEILAQPDYRKAMHAGGQDPQAALRWLWFQLMRLLSRLGGLHETNYGLFLFAVIAGGLVLAVLLAHIGYTVARFLRRKPTRDAPDEAGRPARPLAPDELIGQAERHAATGEYRLAVRALYLALIRHLQLREVLPRTSSQTNWEHLARLGPMPALANIVRPFTRTFDEVWYGGRPGGPAEFAQCRQWLEAALEEVASP